MMMKYTNLQTLVFGALTLAAMPMLAQDGNEYPPNAIPGKCYAKCIIPDEYKTVTEQVLVKEASAKQQVIPAEFGNVTEQMLVKPEAKRLVPVAPVYETVTEQILVKEAGSRLEVTPPVFETVTEQVLDQAEYVRKSTVPPVYETVTERLMVAEASTRWEKGKKDPNCLSANPDDCRVMCLVEVPAQYKTVTKQVIKTPAQTLEERVPAVYKTVTRQVLKVPAQTREIPIPAEYKTVTKQMLRQPATTREEAIPAEYKTISKRVETKPPQVVEIPIAAEYATVTKTVKVREGGMSEWKEVVCENKGDYGAKVIQVQNALRGKGYDPGPTDNVLGPLTRAALIKFQKDNNLPQGRLDYETMKALGIPMN
ncbi:MAG: peptidoglycan-binding domain-containing protein [Bacteroidia bacterium]